MTLRERLNWFRDGRGLDWPRVLFAALTVAVAAAVLVAAATSTAAFGPYNPSWDGAAELRQGIESEPGVESELIRDTARYEASEPEETVAFVVAPDEPYAEEDAERVRRFVEEGGTLVVLENFGTNGNELLAAVSAETRVDGVLLRDEQEHYRGPTMPVATGVTDHPYTEGVDRLTLNHASALEVPDEADEGETADGADEPTVLVRTSEYAYRDTNGNGDLDDDETLDAYPVAAVENVSDGRVVVVGDPSIAINAMLDEPDNRAFLRGTYADADRVLIDASHNEDLPPLTGAVLTFRELPLAQVFVGALGIVGIAALSRRRLRPALERGRPRVGGRLGRADAVARSDRRWDEPFDHRMQALVDRDDVDAHRAAVLRERHPEWDEERVRRVIAALNRDDRKPEDQ